MLINKIYEYFSNPSASLKDAQSPQWTLSKLLWEYIYLWHKITTILVHCTVWKNVRGKQLMSGIRALILGPTIISALRLYFASCLVHSHSFSKSACSSATSMNDESWQKNLSYEFKRKLNIIFLIKIVNFSKR